MDDPDAPGDEEWVHWILVNLPGDLAALPAGFHEGKLPPDAPEGMVQGTNSWGTVGYRGPAPPRGHGLHHYHFKLYALDAMLAVSAGIKKHDLLEALPATSWPGASSSAPIAAIEDLRDRFRPIGRGKSR